ncbi:carboxymuconolactone decarboxylase family protein [Candidatus Mycobacterium methanotrophicum]|uniref:Carboxymuconolactone decarboxylase family protein n=1 Tax=Candidatus Mycobacterium methanotrophicum TaxID=2943498 RepID=A0ABY4QM98_9MYCO|nr:carboxymuconolactone decarboxylase family protein [Candidatus Mycobacterium methanotrophicum]UQX10971.1 carboxymuconolactone decarboxylase family protein [Candidatus Mycobacterium methanotrophicum]
MDVSSEAALTFHRACGLNSGDDVSRRPSAGELLGVHRQLATNDEIKELLMQTAIYCGVPDANTALRTASMVLDDLDAEN